MSRLFIFSFLLLSFSFWLWSFTQTDPNLYYSSTSTWVNFQQMMWQVPRLIVVWWYIGMIILSFMSYFLAMSSKAIKVPLLVIGCWVLVVSNPAFSHDLYNYLFNAKAVAIYRQDPHVLSSLEIAPTDTWVRFMHNVHTPAPYGYFWTYLSVIPFVLGFGKFITTFLTFKIFMGLGLGLLVWLQNKITKDTRALLLFALNPLVLIETLMNGHNDIWMMAFAFGSLYLVLKVKRVFSIQTFVSLLLLILSTQIKLATVLLFPVWGMLILHISLKSVLTSLITLPQRQLDVLSRYLERSCRYWPEIAAILMFLPLLTDRSQQFNPWYLIWSLTFLPFIRVNWIKAALIAFSLTSLLRYLPFLLVAGYSDTVQLHMRLVTWTAIVVTSGWFVVTRKTSK